MVGSRSQPGRSSGITTVHIWLIVFVALWLVSTVIAVLLYTERAELQGALAAAEEDAQRYMGKAEEAHFGNYLEKTTAKLSLARILDNERAALAQLVGMNEAVSATETEQEINSLMAGLAEGAPEGTLLHKLPGSDLKTAIKRLGNAWKEQDESKDEAKKQLAAAQQNLNRERAARQKDAKGFEDALAKLGKENADLKSANAAALAKLDTQIKALQRRITQTQDRLGKKLVAKERELGDVEAERVKMEGKVAQMRSELMAFRPKVPRMGLAAEADARVVRAQADEDLVYIDLGKRDNLTLGLRFEVFSPAAHVELVGGEGGSGASEDAGAQSGREDAAAGQDQPVKVAPGDNLIRGKATIEVVGIHASTSECRVVETRTGDQIVPGDLVLNPVYDRHRKYKFAVEGGFDLDGDRIADPQGAEQIKAWIEAWGGEVVALQQTVEEAPAGSGKGRSRLASGWGLETVDFLVLGGSPPRPAKGTKGVREQDERAAYNRFLAIKKEADSLSLTLLTQSQFLHFVGRAKGGSPRARAAAGGRP